jgi:uncharacterized membrane protein
MIVAGLIGGVVAAVPGSIDWLAIPRNTRAWRIGVVHGLGNVLGVLGLFGASWYFRREEPARPAEVALLLSLGGVLVGSVTAWLGGELVDRLGVGIDRGAHLDSPNSLTGRPASEGQTGTPAVQERRGR